MGSIPVPEPSAIASQWEDDVFNLTGDLRRSLAIGRVRVQDDGDYVDLPDGIASVLGANATFETWTTWNGPESGWWQRIFDLGTSDEGTTCLQTTAGRQMHVNSHFG